MMPFQIYKKRGEEIKGKIQDLMAKQKDSKSENGEEKESSKKEDKTEA